MREPVQPLPLWARVLDAAGVALLLISISVVLTGGFRQMTPFGRVSVTSWLRPAALGVVALVARHAIRRRPSIASRIRALPNRWRSGDAARIWPIFLATRIGVLIVGFLGIALIGYDPHSPPYRVYHNDFLDMPLRWDTGWFMGIALDGYQFDPSARDRMQNIAFFPLYPMLMRYGALFAAGHVLWVGMLASLAAFFWAAIYFLRLARRSLSDDAAAAGLAFLATYPFALFFSAAYTEALFLLAAIAACYHFERDESWKAAAWGLAAGLTRPNGCLLSIVLALIAVRRMHAGGANVRAVGRIAAIAAPAIGLAIFSTYIYALTGNPLQWAAQHAAWGRVYRGFAAVGEQVEYARHGVYEYASSRPLDLLHVAVLGFMVVSIVPVYRRFGAPYAAMILVNVLPPLVMGGLLSMGRISSVIFPAFLWLGAAVPARQRSGWLAAFAMLQALCAIAFFTARPLY